MKVFVAARMIGAFYPTSRTNMARAKFFWEHPEWANRDKDGLPATTHSIAYPEVREYWLTLFREALDYGIDGITLYLNRFKPFVLYEQPVIDSFSKEFSEDPREVPEDDPRWIRHTADYLTAFLREIRKLVTRSRTGTWPAPCTGDLPSMTIPRAGTRYSTTAASRPDQGRADGLSGSDPVSPGSSHQEVE